MIDLSRLQHLMSHDENMVNKFLEIFKSDMPRQLSQIYIHLEHENWDQVSTIAHAIKSQSKYLNLDDLSDLAYTIEKNTESRSHLDLVPIQIKQLEMIIHSALADEVFQKQT